MRQEEEQSNQSSLSSSEPSGKSIFILYDSIRWEEKALYEATIKKGIKVENVNCKNLAINLNDKNSKYRGQVVSSGASATSKTSTLLQHFKASGPR